MDNTNSSILNDRSTGIIHNCDEHETKQTRQDRKPISIKMLWRTFLLESSCHGFRYFVEHRISTKARYAWMLFVIGMSVALGNALVCLSYQYYSFTFKTTWSIRQESKSILPAFTFCIPGDLDMERLNRSSLVVDYVLNQRIINTRMFNENNEELEKYLKSIEGNISNISMTEFHNKSRFVTEDIFVYFEVNRRHLRHGKELSSWVQPVDFGYGGRLCWQMNGCGHNCMRQRRFGHFEEIVILIDVKSHLHPSYSITNGLEIFVHANDETYMSLKSYHLKPGSYAPLYYSKTEHHYLPLPYRSFADQDCVNIGMGKLPLNIWPKYSKISCMFEHTLIKNANRCGCMIPEYITYFPNISECSVVEFEKCFRNADPKILSSLYEDGLKDMGCLHQCSFATHELSFSIEDFPSNNSIEHIKRKKYSTSLEYARQNLILLQIQTKDGSINIIKHEPDVTILSIFGIVGGYMGFFMGASLLTLTEFFEMLVFSIWLFMAAMISKIRHRAATYIIQMKKK